MAYNKKTWLARIGQGLNKFIFNNQSTKVTLESAPDSVSQQGDALSAANMNDLETRIDNEFTAVESLIPNQASSSNQLADKNFVNSSVSTNTADYISDNGNPFTSASNLPTSGVTNNDYAFVTGTDSAGNTYYDRYKATVSGSSVSWAKEYRLNNSSFTAAQWAAISSGITGTQVTSYSSHVSNNDIHVTTSDKSTWSGKYNKPSTGIPKTDLASAVQTSLGKADTAIQSHQSLAAYVQGPASSTDAHVATFNGTGGKTIKDSGFTIGKSVPSNAVFTDTNTKVTSAGNHYTPSYSSTKSASGATGTSGTTVQVVTGVEIDSKGHVTGVVSGAATDTTYSSKSASSGGTAVSLVTTGEKYTWNNKGTYSKPSGGIPSTDMASAVVTSLGKADSSLQSTDIYDGVDSTATNKPLSAKQGKVLNDSKADKVNNATAGNFAGLNSNGNLTDLGLKPADLINMFYPVGTIYETKDVNFDPNTTWGGTWIKITDKFLVAAGSTYSGTGGAASQSITLSTSNLPSHRHSFTPSGSVSSTFSGSSGTVSVSGGNHKHTLYGFKNTGGDGSRAGLSGGYNTDANNAVSYSGDLSMSGSFTPSGSVSSTFSGTAGNTGYKGDGAAFTVDTIPPYQAVYIWERTS